MQRILVMGSSGSGKSTFGRRLSELTGIPFVSLDALFWKPGWVASDNAEFGQRVAEVARQPQDRRRAHLLLQKHGRGVIRFEQRLAQRHLVLLVRALVARNPDAFRRVHRDFADAGDRRDR